MTELSNAQTFMVCATVVICLHLIIQFIVALILRKDEISKWKITDNQSESVKL